MWPYHPQLIQRAVPRYTSYPTAAEFRSVGADFHQAGFSSIPEAAPISLYLHIPYCKKICWYCACNTGAANKSSRLTAYLDALHAEIDLVRERIGGSHPITQIAFGGGSPNAIPPVDFVRLVDHLTTAFDPCEARFSIELDPRSLTDEWFEAIGGVGISHASLGVQTFEPAIQQAMGRIQPYEQVAESVVSLRKCGVSSLNFDLMYGLPGQGLTELYRTLDQTLELKPDRVALFGYAHLPQRIARQRRIDGSALPDMKQRFEMAAYGFERLTKAGYLPIGFDHFAVPEDGLARSMARNSIRRNFQGFTDDPADILLGLGASAISAFPDRFVQNDRNAGRYRMRVSAGRLSGAVGILRNVEDLQRESVISSLLCSGSARFDRAIVPTQNWLMLDALWTLGLLDLTDDRLEITAAGRPYSRVIASLFDVHRSPAEGRFSEAI